MTCDSLCGGSRGKGSVTHLIEWLLLFLKNALAQSPENEQEGEDAQHPSTATLILAILETAGIAARLHLYSDPLNDKGQIADTLFRWRVKQMTDYFHFKDAWHPWQPSKKPVFTRSAVTYNLAALGSSGTSKWRERGKQMMFIRSFNGAEWVKCKTMGNGSGPSGHRSRWII